MVVDVRKLIDVMKRKGYVVFEDERKDYNLNIVGVRSENKTPGKFDDTLYVFWKFKGKWTLHSYSITTDPGQYYLKHPMNVNGTVILKPGQYRGMWKIGLHKGKYKALVQARPVTVIRDRNKDDILDFDSPNEQTGMFGINLHHASSYGVSENVGRWSAGCQVFADIEEFNEMMDLAERAKANWGNSFSYTLLEQKDFA